MMKKLLAGVAAVCAILMTTSSTFAQDIANYLPHAAGNQWSYINNVYATKTDTIGSPVMLPSGTVAFPWTGVDSSQPGYQVTYNTIDEYGFRRYQEYISSVYISGYGNTTATAIYSPALLVLPANVTLGNTYSSTGVVTFTYANVTTATLNYYSSTNPIEYGYCTDNHVGIR